MTSGATTAGRYIFSGTNTYLGVTGFNNPNAGTLLVNGTQSSSSIYFGAGTGTLGGSGTVGDLLLSQTNHGCRVSPGAVPGPGILHSGSANLRYAQFVVEVNGDTAGNQLDNYDQLQVTGSVTLGSTLTVSIGNAFTPSIGQQFKIIDNDGSDLVSGTFKDLPEGSLLTLGRNVLRISYAGGDGNDIVLTSVPAAFWDGVPDGGGVSTNANWRTVTNWVGDREPSPGDNLIFPAGPSVVNTVNDFPAETVFGALVISGSGYTLSGKEITLQSGINASGSNNTLSLPITLSAPQMIAGYGGLSLNGLLDQDGHALTFGGTGTTVNGELTGAGGVVILGTGVVFAGANSYSGSTTISGQLSIRNNLALGVADGTNASGTMLSGGTLTLDGVLTVGGELLTANAGSLTATGNSAWGGDVVVGGLLLRTAKDTTFTISGNISGSGGVTVDGGMTSGATTAGRYIFSGTNTYLGVTGFNNPNAGTLLVNGTQSSSSIYFGAGTGTLGGSGTVGDLLLSQTNHGCRVSPGAVPGPGILHSGSANLRYAQFVVEINGDTAGNNFDNYDQLQVSGTVTLGSTLTASIGNAFTPSIGQQFTIIDNDGSSDPVSGTFKDLAEGSLLMVGRNVLRISYAGGDGNDVVLTAETVPIATSEIGGNVFDDLDKSQGRSGSEPGLAGWVVYLDQNNNATLDPDERRSSTDANGDYTFARLADATYTVREVLPYGWMQTSPGGPDYRYVVTLATGELVSGRDFGNFQQAPTHIDLSNSSVPEQAAVGSVVGNFTTVDRDAGDTFTYTLVSGAGSDDNTSFTIVGNELRTAVMFDFETKASYAIRVRTADAGGLWHEEAFTISVTDVNEIPPTVTGTTPSFATSGTLAAGTTSLQISFSAPVLGGGTAGNYQLQSLGSDALLGTADDTIVSLIAAYAGNTATLSFAALPESVYRLTVRATIANVAGTALDGDGNGTAGGDWVSDVVVFPAGGDLLYSTPTYSSGGTYPSLVAIGDLNGDGRADLAVANSGSGNVGVLLGQVGGTFWRRRRTAPAAALPGRWRSGI